MSAKRKAKKGQRHPLAGQPQMNAPKLRLGDSESQIIDDSGLDARELDEYTRVELNQPGFGVLYEWASRRGLLCQIKDGVCNLRRGRRFATWDIGAGRLVLEANSSLQVSDWRQLIAVLQRQWPGATRQPSKIRGDWLTAGALDQQEGCVNEELVPTEYLDAYRTGIRMHKRE